MKAWHNRTLLCYHYVLYSYLCLNENDLLNINFAVSDYLSTTMNTVNITAIVKVKHIYLTCQ